MIVDIVMPKMGESINEGTILEWRKNIGDSIELDEILLEIGTDKVDSEIPSSSSGVLVEILAQPNDIIEVGKVIARIDSDKKNDFSMLDQDDLNKDINLELSDKKNTKDIQGNDKKIELSNKFYSPVVMKIVAEKNISINELKNILGSGRGGRVTKKDILSYIAKKDLELKSISSTSQKKNKENSKNFEISKLSNIDNQKRIQIKDRVEELGHMRKLISSHMKESIETSAHVYLMTEIDMTSIVDFVKLENQKFYNREGFKLTYTPFIIKAAIKSLENYPKMNSSLSDNSIHYHKNINIGMAVSIDDGLMVPSIFNCEEKSFLGICRSVNDISIRTREKRISTDELSGSTFSITNFGIFGVSMGTPIINQPNVGILGIGAIKKMPIIVECIDGDDSIAIRSMMVATLGFDHRLIDGAGGASFLEYFRKNIENMDLKSLF